MTGKPWMLYGANGYTGRLILEEALARNHKPVVAGRNRPEILELADRFGLPSRIFNLDRGRHDDLAGIEAVLHCAGPFIHTARKMVSACLRARVHYLDITGEIDVFEEISSLDGHARNAGVTLIPGVGFDVVPTDTLALMLKNALPSAESLSLAFFARGSRVSRGTLRTMIEGLPGGGAVRRDGSIVRVPPAFEAREIPFSCGSRWAMTIPWGDVSTAYRTTGIPNIRVYSAAPLQTIQTVRRTRLLMPLLGIKPLRRLLQHFAGNRTGADAAERAEARTFLWGEAVAPGGESRSLTMETPDGYSLTAASAVRAVEAVLPGGIAPGVSTPAAAFGVSFLESLPGVTIGEMSSNR